MTDVLFEVIFCFYDIRCGEGRECYEIMESLQFVVFLMELGLAFSCFQVQDTVQSQWGLFIVGGGGVCWQRGMVMIVEGWGFILVLRIFNIEYLVGGIVVFQRGRGGFRLSVLGRQERRGEEVGLSLLYFRILCRVFLKESVRICFLVFGQFY